MKTKPLIFKLEEINKIPSSIGVYLFLDSKKKPLYIGKSVNLIARIKSHLKSAEIDPKERAIVQKTKYIKIYPTESEYTSLILEAKLIKKYLPPYNKIWKDGKSYLYIKITNEEYPKVYPVRETETKDALFSIGPFQSMKVVNSILSTLRKITPFCSQKKLSKRPCFYSKLKLCEPCPNQIENTTDAKLKKFLKKKYLKNIKTLIELLKGNTEKLEKSLIKKIQSLSKKNKFEEAIIYREKLKRLEQLRRINFLDYETIGLEEKYKKLKEFFYKYFGLKKLERIECYDISNWGDKAVVAAMVVLEDGILNKKEYRKFKAKLQKQSDIDQLVQVLSRRFKNQWKKPDLIVVDGGKPQLLAIYKSGVVPNEITVIGLAKRPDRIVFLTKDLTTQTLYITPENSFLNLLALLRDEAHRFAQKYHKELRRKINQQNITANKD